MQELVRVDAKQFIKENLSQRAIILQLSEEASELSTAASKLLRVLDGENPSPVSPGEAWLNLLEEYGDVLNCLDVLLLPTDNLVAVDTRKEKLIRWAERIREKQAKERGNMEAGETKNEAGKEGRQNG